MGPACKSLLLRELKHAVLGDGLGEGRMIEHVALGFDHAGKDVADLAGPLVLAVGAAAIGDAAQARKRRNRAIDDAQNLAERHAIRRHQQVVAAMLPPLALQDAVALQLQQNLLEKFAGDTLLE